MVCFTDGAEHESMSGLSMSTRNLSALKGAVMVMSVALKNFVHG
ncbi:Unknown protein sequence [Pseudomonas coronafaciens pv. oryzae]|nr:Unknown protein sequence [Pseudomonas coronafaciens pv. oryzae]